ncbi:polysaccharide pyruvyl transferase family protein [Ruminococcus sp. OM05-10BH]|nr:polysaccharide pyruvyl transferase family protein [Ruminococcus sp. OM05-10BH]
MKGNMKKKIFVNAYLNNNFGDDLLIYLLCQRYPDFEFYINADETYIEHFEGVWNIHGIEYKNNILKKIINRLLILLKCPRLQILKLKKENFDINILLGGSIFIENKSFWEVKYNEEKFLRKYIEKNLIMGSNFGPYQSEKFFKSYKREFSKYDFISFRDKYSYNLFPHCPQITMGADIAFSGNYFPQEKRNNYCLISVIDCKRRTDLKQFDDNYIKMISNIVKAEVSNKEIILASFCDNEGDIETINRIIRTLSDDEKTKVKIYRHKNVCESIMMITGASLIIGTRFHSIVLALKCGIPILPIIYSDKTKNLLNDIKFKGEVIDIRKMPKGKICINNIQPYEIKEEVVSSSNRHFEYLDNIYYK